MNYLEMYKETLRFQESSEDTVKAYTTDIKLMLNSIDKEPQDVTPLDLMQYQNTIKDLADTTKTRKINAIKAFFAWLVDLQVIEKNPSIAMKAPKIKTKEVRYTPSDDDIELMLDMAGNIKLKALITVLSTTGLRFSELASIKLSDVSDGKEVVVDKFSIMGKGSKVREVFLNESAKKAINLYLKYDRKVAKCDALFVSNQGGELENASVNRMIKTLCKKCKIIGDGVECHMFRRYMATKLWAKGVNPAVIMSIMGHSAKSGFSVEMGHYVSVSEEDKRAAIQ